MRKSLAVIFVILCCTGSLYAKEPLPFKLDYILGLDRNDISLTLLSDKFGLVEIYGYGNLDNAKCYEDLTHIIEFYETSTGYGYTIQNKSEPFGYVRKCGKLTKPISIVKTSEIFSFEMKDILKSLGNRYTKEEKFKQTHNDFVNNKKPEKQITYSWIVNSTTIRIQFKNNNPYWLNVSTEDF